MEVKYSYLAEQFEGVDAYLEDIRELVRSGEFTLGPYVERFERKFADFVGAKHVISTNSGTDALILSLKAVGVRPGDEVITVANSFYATAGAIVAAGARPVFVDTDERYLMDVSRIQSAITDRTRAIIPVHWAGSPCDIEEIMRIAERHGLAVVEDACPAVGARVNGRSVGTFGRSNAFSMHPLKPLNVWGDGGMVVTNDDGIAEFLRRYRNHGMVDRDHISMWGVNSRLQPIQAVVAFRLLDQVEDLIQARVRNARLLDQGLSDLSEQVVIPPRPSSFGEVYQLYLVSCRRRDALLGFLNQNGIEAKVHYPIPLHLQPPGRELGYREGSFPACERQASEVISLPAHQHLRPEQIHHMIKVIHEFYGGSSS